ncbi:Mth938-like domain-containing protein [Chromobacterium violaceum]|uniref:Mth938-like domain-containing protein n=1 Tax=Chromobacterium violaceum TaxID=536 RepID=UPI0038586876
MKMQQSLGPGQNLFTGYGAGHVLINAQRHDGNLIVSADEISAWAAPDCAGLAAAHFEALLAYRPEVVLFGSGATQRFVHPRLYAALTQAGIGVECMDTQAVCRTFNILLAEDRRVVAALLAI